MAAGVTPRVGAALASIRMRTDIVPAVAVILGSGQSDILDEAVGFSIPYADIPGFPVATAPSHRGALFVGRLGSVPVVAMQGRVHLYEGYQPQDPALPIRLMAALGASTLILTNAAGGLYPDYQVGDVVLIEDHISLPHLAGADPLRGPNDDSVGGRFISLNHAYDPALLAAAAEVLSALGVPVRRGVYAHVVGPSFETPAEVRALRLLGGDLVGMSTAPEVVLARHAGLRVLAMSLVTNKCVASLQGADVASEADVWAALEAAGPRMSTIIRDLIDRLGRDHAG